MMIKSEFPSCSLIIATYNWPEALEKSIKSAFIQLCPPQEIIIADDGSDERTTALIKELARQTSIPIVHIWHTDKGFRLSEIRNKAMAAAKNDYIIQIDGDIIMDKHFIADHLSVATKGTFLCGSRVLLKKRLSNDLLHQDHPLIQRSKLSLGYVLNSIRLPFLGKLLLDVYKRNQPTALRGCNMSFWRSDLLAVNGYNAGITGWGSEDAELAIRLINKGVKKRFLKFMAIAYHLYHPENNRDNRSRNEQLLKYTMDNHLIRIKNGIEKNE